MARTYNHPKLLALHYVSPLLSSLPRSPLPLLLILIFPVALFVLALLKVLIFPPSPLAVIDTSPFLVFVNSLTPPLPSPSYPPPSLHPTSPPLVPPSLLPLFLPLLPAASSSLFPPPPSFLLPPLFPFSCFSSNDCSEC